MTELQKLCNANVLPKKITIPRPTPQSAYDVERMLEEEDEEYEEYNPCTDADYCEECPYYDKEKFCTYDDEEGEDYSYDYPN